MIPFGLAPALLRKGLQIMRGGLERLNEQQGSTAGIPQAAQAQATRNTRNIQTPFDYQPDPFAEKANALRRKLAGNDYMHTSGYHRYDGLEPGSLGGRESITAMQMPGSYDVMKETTQDQIGVYKGTNRPKYGPASSEISFRHDVFQYSPYPKNPFARGTTQYADFDYIARLENAGLRYMMGRQIDGIKVGNYLQGAPLDHTRSVLYRRGTGGALQYPLARQGSSAGLMAKARREGSTTWKPVTPYEGTDLAPEPLRNAKTDKFGNVKFDPKSLKTALKEMGKEIVTYKLTNNRLVPGRMRLPGWAQVFMEAEQMYQGMTGRSLTKDTFEKSRETLMPHTEQVGKNKFLPSGLAF